MCEFDKLDKTFASDLYLIYKRSPSASVCISDKDQLLMFYLSLKARPQIMHSTMTCNNAANTISYSLKGACSQYDWQELNEPNM